MKQSERASIMRIVSDMVKADAIIDIKEIDFLNEIRNKYGIKHDDEMLADSLTLSEAISILKDSSVSLRQDLWGDFRGMALSDNACSREEAMLLLGLMASLSEKLSEQAEVYSVELTEDYTYDNSQVLYVEGEYYKEANREIISQYREIINELRLIGLNFVYIPKVGEHYNTLSKDEMDNLLSFLYPMINDSQIEKITKQITTLSTSDFCKSELVNRLKIKSLQHSLPSLLLNIGKSVVNGKVYSNYLVITIEEDVLFFVRKLVDSFVTFFKPRILNPVYEEPNRFVYSGFYKKLFDTFIYKKGIRSTVVVDILNGDILLPEADVKLTGLHRREKALYTLFLLESSTGGINFNKPDGLKALERYNHRIELIQKKYEIIYKYFGGDPSKAPSIELPENRLPMISFIKKQFRQMGELLNQPDDYLVQRNLFGNYCVNIPSELCLCVDVKTRKVCQFSESEFWSHLLAM